MSYRFSVTVCGIKIKDEVREGELPMPNVAGFLEDMKKLGVKTTASVNIASPSKQENDQRQALKEGEL